MNLRLLLAATAAFGFGAMSAQAAIVVDHKVANQLFGLDSGVTLIDFDGVQSAAVSYVGHTVAPGDFEDPISTSAPPPFTGPTPTPATTHDGSTPILVDPTVYASVQGGQLATLSILSG